MWESIMGLFRDQAPPADMTPHVEPAGRSSSAVFSDPDMPGLPGTARPIVRSINDYIESITKRIADNPLGMPLVIEMEQMRDRHLPLLLTSYRNIPDEHRKQIYNETGLSASVHLSTSLTDMCNRLKDIDRSLAKEHINTFADNARFIQDTYGRQRDVDPLS